MNATVTIGIEDYQKMKSQIDSLTGQLAAAKAEVDQAKLGGEESTARALAQALDHSLQVVRFAIENLHPLTVRGWPYEALRALGLAVADLPGIDASVREVARGDWTLLTAEMERWERARAEGREKELLAEENAARAPGPDHPIFGGAA